MHLSNPAPRGCGPGLKAITRWRPEWSCYCAPSMADSPGSEIRGSKVKRPTAGWVNFAAIPDHIGALSGGEQRLLMIAASLGADNEPVDLSYAVSGLNRATLTLVLAAISHAAGSQQHTEFLPSLSDNGTLIISLESPRLELGPLFPWPQQ